MKRSISNSRGTLEVFIGESRHLLEILAVFAETAQVVCLMQRGPGPFNDVRAHRLSKKRFSSPLPSRRRQSISPPHRANLRLFYSIIFFLVEPLLADPVRSTRALGILFTLLESYLYAGKDSSGSMNWDAVL